MIQKVGSIFLVLLFSILGLLLSLKYAPKVSAQDSKEVTQSQSDSLKDVKNIMQKKEENIKDIENMSSSTQVQNGEDTETIQGEYEVPMIDDTTLNQFKKINEYKIEPFKSLQPTIEGFIYDPIGKRDPFRPYSDIRTSLGVEDNDQLEDLQKYEIDKLTVTGILWNVTNPKALVRDPNGSIHLVIKGQKLGRNEGYVYDIREGEVIVIESFEEAGKIVRESKILSIR